MTEPEMDMRTSTPTLDLNPALVWRHGAVRKARRQAPAVAGPTEQVPAHDRATDEGRVSRSREVRSRPGIGVALEFALFAGTLAAVGWLHFELLGVFL
jgi:hypothetical protein